MRPCPVKAGWLAVGRDRVCAADIVWVPRLPVQEEPPSALQQSTVLFLIHGEHGLNRHADNKVYQHPEYLRRVHLGFLDYFCFSGKQSEFEAELQSAGGRLIVVDFSATWCGPCKMIKPFFHSLCEKYGDVVFIEIDVDDAQDVAAHCDVKCMPTFQFYKNGKKVQEFSGANKEKLEETIKSLV
ncbi:thioredoxin-like [Pezoporus occidentalis]|uniref:thioredoxin-like n=1 Tax=Pezoporus occidentalis TaxID=407982 RepID=UPI002F90F114